MAYHYRGLFFILILAGSFNVFAQDEIADPVKPIETGDLEVRLSNWVTLPKSSNSKPYARINMLREIPDGSGRMAVNDLNGPFYLIPDSTQVYEYLDFKDKFPNFQYTKGKGSGFGGFAFHPDFEDNGIFFTTHSESPGQVEADFKATESDGIDVQWVLTRWKATAPSSNSFSGTHDEMARWDFPTVIHGAQDISFNPYAEPGGDDYGMLYICLGEGGSGLNKLHNNMQNTSSHLGTIWRIDPLGTNSLTGEYGIPSDNPFVNTAGALGEVWAYGFRNPHRIHFEKRNEEILLFTGDIGELNIEEVNIVRKGGNYGWDEREGTFLFDIERSRETLYKLPEDDHPDYIYPVAQYDHDDGLAINLGHVWHSERVPGFDGIFFMGDIPTGRIFYALVDSLEQNSLYALKAAKTFNALNQEKSLSEIVENNRVDIKFGYDASGEVYFLTKADGVIYKVGVPGEEIIDIDTTGVLLASEEIKPPSPIYPTLVSDRLIVQHSSGHAFITIMDMHGRVFVRQELSESEFELDVSMLAPGVFVAVIEAGNQKTETRFIKVNDQN